MPDAKAKKRKDDSPKTSKNSPIRDLKVKEIIDESLLKSTKKLELNELMGHVFLRKPKEGRGKINFNKKRVENCSK